MEPRAFSLNAALRSHVHHSTVLIGYRTCEPSRLAASIKYGTVAASLMLRKLGSYPRQNGLPIGLCEQERLERTLFMLDWLQNIELRGRLLRVGPGRSPQP